MWASPKQAGFILHKQEQGMFRLWRSSYRPERGCKEQDRKIVWPWSVCSEESVALSILCQPG